MADIHNDIDTKTRSNLAYIWSYAIIAMVGYTLYTFGHILAVLTLIIGFITGTAATILAVYFGAVPTNKKPDAQIVQTGDQPTANTTTDEQK